MKHLDWGRNSRILNCTGNMFTFDALYREAVQNCRHGGLLVEVGVWTGHSLSYLTVEAANAEKDIRVFGVDVFAGNIYSANGKDGAVQMERLAQNLAPVWPMFGLVKARSIEAAPMFQQADMVFIDGDHSYAEVSADLEAWYPVVRDGGIFAGHDIHLPDVTIAVAEFASRHGLKVTTYGEEKDSGYGYCWVLKKGIV